jgi:Secretion system C-terminal sorting domain
MTTQTTCFSHLLRAKLLAVALLFLLNWSKSSAQISVTLTGPLCNGTYSLTANGVVNGKNSYIGSYSGLPMTLSWSTVSSRWELGSSLLGVLFYNNATSSPEPPCHNNGTWVGFNSCVSTTLTASTGNCAPLPIELYHFSVKNGANVNSLTWQTASEVKNKGFDIERSNDGLAWQTLSFMAAKGPNSTYEFTDKAPLSVSYYRLRQVDFDEKFDFSKIIVVKNAYAKSPILVFPNPNKTGILNIQGLTGEKTAISITNIYGQTVFQQTTSNESVALTVKNILAKGVYFVHVKDNQTFSTQKISVE